MTQGQIVRLFVNGQGMRGGALNGPLAEQSFAGPATTAPRYRFYSVRDEFPALLPIEPIEPIGPGDGGTAVTAVTAVTAGIEGELYEVELAVLRDVFLPAEPPELELAAIEMADGSGAFAVRLRPGLESTLPGLTDITAIASWRRYLASLA